MKKHFIFLVIALSGCECMLLDLFTEKDRHGMSIRIEVDDRDCSNLPISWSSKAASVNTLGSCVQFYDEPFCKGALTIIQPFHTIHQMDMSLINFAKRIQSASACGAKVKSGRFVIQNAEDASILTVNSKYGGFGRAFTAKASNLITKAQQWDVIELSNSEYTLKPREYEDNFPVSYDEEGLKIGKIKKKLWKLMSVGRGRYLIKNEPNQRCLYKTEEDRVEEHDCRIWSPNQEWVFKEIFGNAKPAKKSAAAGPGLNYNILSKVASYIPPTKPPPQFEPIFYNATILSQLRRRSTATPYIIRKKIRRGPRPQSRPVPLLLTHIRPPGLREKPALSAKVANNNKFLLLKNKRPVDLKEFEPTDDRIETYAYYQQVLLANMKKEDLLKELKKRKKEKQTAFPPSNHNNKDEDEDSNSEEEDEEEDDIEGEKRRRKKKKDIENEEDEEEDYHEGERRRRRKKKKERESEEERQDDNRDEEDSDEDGERKKKKRRRPPPDPYNPYDMDYNHTLPEPPHDDEINTGFITSMFSKVKSGLGSFSFVPSIKFINASKNSTSGSVGVADSVGQGSHYHPLKDEYRPKESRRRPQSHPHLLRPHPPKDLREEEEQTPSSTTTTAKPKLWSFLG